MFVEVGDLVARVSPITGYHPPVTALLAVAFLGEPVTLTLVLAIVVGGQPCRAADLADECENDLTWRRRRISECPADRQAEVDLLEDIGGIQWWAHSRHSI